MRAMRLRCWRNICSQRKRYRGTAVSVLVLVLALVAVLSDRLSAESRRQTFGALVLDFDDQIWRLIADGEARWKLEPLEPRELALVRVTVEKLEGARSCQEIAAEQFTGASYVQPQMTKAQVAGVPAVRLVAHTRCKNATPLGVVICVPHGGLAHVFASTISGCRNAGNPFTRKDTVDALVDAVRRVDQ